jgi:hypothetical protein
MMAGTISGFQPSFILAGRLQNTTHLIVTFPLVEESFPKIDVTLGNHTCRIVLLDKGTTGTCHLRQLVPVLNKPAQLAVNIALDKR